MIDNFRNEETKIIRLIATRQLIDLTANSWKKSLHAVRTERDSIQKDKTSETNKDQQDCIVAGLDLAISILEGNISDFEYFVDTASKAQKLEEQLATQLAKDRINGLN